MSYQFPTLSVEDCIKWLQNYKIKVEEQDFRKPVSERWYGIFCQILEALTEVPFENMLQKAEFQAKASFEFPELHDESMPLMTLCLALRRFLSSCGVQDFTIQDVLSPKKPRLVKISSAVINFLLFKETRMEVFLHLKEKNEKHKEQHEGLRKANEQMKRRIQAIKLEQADQEPYVKAVQEEVDFVKQKIENHYKMKAQQQQHISDLRDGIAARKAQIDQIRVRTAQAKEECESISRKIIQSPDRVMADEEKARESLLSLKSSIDKKRGVLVEKQQQIESVQLSAQNVEKCLKMLQDIQVDVDKENEIDREIQSVNDKCQEQRNLLRDLGSKREQQQHLINSRREKLSKLNLHHQQKIRSTQETIQQLHEQIAFYEKKCGDDEKKKNYYMQEKQKLEQELVYEQKILDNKIEASQNLYAEIMKKMDMYNAGLGKGWEELKAVLQ